MGCPCEKIKPQYEIVNKQGRVVFQTPHLVTAEVEARLGKGTVREATQYEVVKDGVRLAGPTTNRPAADAAAERRQGTVREVVRGCPSCQPG